MSQSPSLRLDLKPSLLLAGALGAIHVLALAATAAVGGWPALPVAAGIALSCAVTVAHALQRTASATRAFELHADGRGAWQDRAGRWHQARLLPRRLVTSALVILALKGKGARKWIVLAPDACDGESLRRLRAWLRWRVDATGEHVAEA
jgi:membrane-bound toxin of toxin-antitoxin system